MRRLPQVPLLEGGFLLPASIDRIDADGAVWVSSGGCAPERALVAELACAAEPLVAGTRVLLVCGPGEPPTIVSAVHDRIATPRRIVLEAAEQIVLRCGGAELELEGDGSVRIRGGYVETDAEGVCRIVGAQVRIN